VLTRTRAARGLTPVLALGAHARRVHDGRVLTGLNVIKDIMSFMNRRVQNEFTGCERGQRLENFVVLQGEQLAGDYAALFNPEHPKWNAYAAEVRDDIRVLIELDVKQMRPLLLAVARNFTAAQVAIAFNRLISWAVRLTVAGGSRAGRLDTFYANLGYRVNTRELRDYSDLINAATTAIPKDAEFQSFFQSVRVKISKRARYYLRCLEVASQLETGGEHVPLIPNFSTKAVNLEHVMPQTACNGWAVSTQDMEIYAHRLGNLALLEAQQNVDLDRESFSEKRAILAASPFKLTSMIGEFSNWGVVEIEQRQQRLALFAPKAWPT